MKEEKFINLNINHWKQLETAASSFKSKGRKGFNKQDFEDFMNLYNKACSHLSYSRTNYGNTSTTQYLNKLVSNSQEFLYSTRVTSGKKLYHFFVCEFPMLLLQYKYAILIAMLLFAAGGLLSFTYTLQNPSNALAFLPEQFAANIESFGEDVAAESWDNPVMSSFILTNNIRVGFLAFASGIFLGLGTLYILIYNGFPLGSLAALSVQKGISLKFWSLILPHGVLELFAIFVCGAAGLIIGYSLINPGKYSRRDSLIIKVKIAVKLVLGTIPIFIIAGIIEGFFTGSQVTEYTKLGFALATLVALLLYIYIPNSLIKLKKLDKQL